MTKPITIVGMLLLHRKDLVKWDDPVSKYIPYFKELKIQKDGKILPCKNELKVIHLMTHRSDSATMVNPCFNNSEGEQEVLHLRSHKPTNKI